MQFSDTSGYTGIIQDIDYILFGSSVLASDYSIADKTRNINNWYDSVVALILRADDRWEWDDNNKTDLPIGTFDLVSGQQDYGITAATFLKILKVEVQDAQGNWHNLRPISLQDKKSESMTDYKKEAGTPEEYDKIGNSLLLYPKPSASITGGLKVFYQRNVTHFVVSDTVAVPGFAENFHKILSYGAAMDYAVANEMNTKISILSSLITKTEQAIMDYYSTRNDRDDEVCMSVENSEDYGQDSGIDTFSGVSFI
jgi:hypothetical protein